MGDLKVRNTLTKSTEVFTPLEEGKVGMYVCGPTVYNYVHVGNMRPPVVFNMLRGWLEKKGLVVRHVQNFTDVDDRIIEQSIKEGIPTTQITEKYIEAFNKDFERMGLRLPHEQPKVTDYIPQIIDLIGKLVENGKAYEVEGEVFYSVEAFEDYGKLSKKDLDDLQAGIRVEIGDLKRNPMDFSLWKPAKPGEPKWESPWGEGRPGWHIECSAMSLNLLGESFDIHGGGIDLIFPHHENEIAQSEGVTGKPMVKYWMHSNFINMGGEKMSKSLGNVMRAHDFIETYHPEILKYLLLMAHYRSHSDFSEKQIHMAIQQLARIYSGLCLAERVLEKGVDPVNDGEFSKKLEEAEKAVENAFDDDLNTPEVLARVFEMIRTFNSGYRIGQKVNAPVADRALKLKKFVRETGAIMSLFQEPPHEFLTRLDDLLLEKKKISRKDVNELVAKRKEARDKKDWAESDRVRDELVVLGIAVSDTPEGTTWEVQK